MFQKKDPLFFGGLVQEEFLFFKGEQRSRVVAHDVGQWDVSRAWEQVSHEGCGGSVGVAQQRDHLAFCVAVCEKNIPAFNPHRVGDGAPMSWDHFELTRLGERGQIFSQERGFFSWVGGHGPLPVVGVGPIRGIGKGGPELAIGQSLDGPADVVEVQVGEKHICDVFSGTARRGQSLVQAVVPVEVVMAEELLGLFLTNAAIDEHPSAADFYEERPHGPCAEVQVVGRIGAGPKLLGDDPKHGSTIQLEIPCMDRVKAHGRKVPMRG